MQLKKLIVKERLLWHKHFLPSLLTALVVGLLSFIYEYNTSSIVLFASIGASATILTHSRSHHLTKLHTTIKAYILAIIISLLVYLLNSVIPLHNSINIFLLIFLVSLSLFLTNAVHPPAIGAAISFILRKESLAELAYLFTAVILLLIAVRFLAYLLSQHLSVKEFEKEFKKEYLRKI